MFTETERKRRYRTALLSGAATLLVTSITGVGLTTSAIAQDQDDDTIEEVVVTGTRIKNPNVSAASPVTVIDMDELNRTMTPNIERVFRDLPITIPGDGENVNNGTAGQATIDLRGLGPERSLIMIDGKRLNPYDVNGQVSVDSIPMIMLERVDIVTGGASAVYGSDAMSGAVNFILRKNFEGAEIDAGWGTTDQGEGTIYDVSAIFGANIADGRGNVTVAASYTERKAVLLSDRDFGLFGVASDTGSGLSEPPPEPAAECSGNTEFTTDHPSNVGSTTSIPATLNLRSGNSYQFRDDLSLVLGECARFNFNPFNYYQTPQTRYQMMTTAEYEITDNIEMYGRASFSKNESSFQIAPSGTFGATFTIPVMNPFFTDATRTTIVDDLNTFAAANAGAVPGDTLGFGIAGIVDVNGDGVFDTNDAFLSTARRRTLELGPRTGIFKTNTWQMVWGLRGELPLEGWDYDVSWQRGESDFVETRDGFTNLTNLALGIDTVDANSCTSVFGTVTAAPCTPINIFGPVGSITEQQRDDGFFIAIASDLRKSTQTIVNASVSGPVNGLQSPWADGPVSVAFGAEYRKETATSSPDECLKLAPASCQGGAGGNRLPVSASYDAKEGFIETIIPLVAGESFAEHLDIEAGVRFSKFDPQGNTTTWKAGLSWEVVPGFRVRYMEQKATRVPNIAEIGTPVTTGLDNATFDPCSVGNTGTISAELAALCIATGVPASLVGLVPDIISGQVNQFFGTDLLNLPKPETARSRTIGVVWQPDTAALGNFNGTTISVDYYDIDITDYIDAPSGQESMDSCYVLADPITCSQIVRIGGALTVSGTGVPGFTTNFDFFRAEGIQLSVDTGYDLGEMGQLRFSFNGNMYLTNEFQTTATSAIVDCKGRYGTSCDPVPKWRHTARASWFMDNVDASLLWRYVGGMDAQASEAAFLFPAFQSVSAQSYFDFSAGYQVTEYARIEGLIRNVANKNPPILGNETGSTSFNSGNTFPSIYDVLGRVYSVNIRATF